MKEKASPNGLCILYITFKSLEQLKGTVTIFFNTWRLISYLGPVQLHRFIQLQTGDTAHLDS